MKKLILIAILSAFSLTGFAQFASETTVYKKKAEPKVEKSFIFGPRVGLNIPFDDDIRFNGGIVTEFKLSNSFWFSTGLYFTTREFYKYYLYKWRHYDFQNLRLPLLVLNKWEKNNFGFQVQCGTFVEYSLFKSRSYYYYEYYDNTRTRVNKDYRLCFTGFNIGLGLTYRNIYLGCDFEYGIGIDEDFDFRDDLSESCINISIGYNF